jgi:hypothetical protein
MEIKFNPTRMATSDSGISQAVASRADPPAVAPAGSFENTAALESKLQDISLVRPQQVDRAKALVADVMYPPDTLMNGISVLLAIHLSQ